MIITIKEILKEQGLPSKEIDIRFKQNRIKLNGEPITNITLDILEIHDAGDFMFNFYSKHKISENYVIKTMFRIIGIENIFDCNLTGEIFRELKQYCLLQLSKKEHLILKLNK